MWRCPQCGEKHEQQFAACWKCGGERPSLHPAGCKCCTCGVSLPAEETVWGFAAPDIVGSIPETERAGRMVLTPDQCIVDDRFFFIAARLTIPVAETEGAVRFTCWISISNTSHERICDSWKDPKRVDENLYFGWFSNRLPIYPDTLNLKVQLHQQLPGTKPNIELEPTDHPLAVDFRNGMSAEKANEFRRLLDTQA